MRRVFGKQQKRHAGAKTKRRSKRSSSSSTCTCTLVVLVKAKMSEELARREAGFPRLDAREKRPPRHKHAWL